MGESDYLFYFYMSLTDISGQILPVIHMIFCITFHVFYCSTMLLPKPISHGENDYLESDAEV
jgi:hypothetical protein